MKLLVIFATLVISTLARPQYGVPSRPQQTVPFVNSEAMQSSHSSSSSSSSSSNTGTGNRVMMMKMLNDVSVPKVYKHISIHVAPPEEFEAPKMKRIIRPMEKPNKIVNIIFVKAPNQSSNRMTEIILPSQPETRTVVYVLLRKRNNDNDVKIRQPKPTKSSPPEVFFIKYGKSQGGAGEVDAGTGASVPSSKPQEYGVPSNA